MFRKEIEDAIKTLFEVSTLLSRILRWSKEFGATVSPDVEALFSQTKKKLDSLPRVTMF